MRRLLAILITLVMLAGCATVKPGIYTDSNPRWEILGMEQPYSSMVLITIRDRETGREYLVTATPGGVTIILIR